MTHVTVYAEDGFGPGEVAALTAVREVSLPAGGDRENVLCVQLIGLGAAALFRATVPIFKQSKTWASATPFVAHRHPKRRGTKRDAPAPEPHGRGTFAELSVREVVALRNRAPWSASRCRPTWWAAFARPRTSAVVPGRATTARRVRSNLRRARIRPRVFGVCLSLRARAVRAA